MTQRPTYDEVLNALKTLRHRYLVLLEIGRDRIRDYGGECDPLEVMERGDFSLKDADAVIAVAEKHPPHDDLQARVAQLEGALRHAFDFIQHAEVSSGLCCCGDSMKGHGDVFETGHFPVDMWDDASRSMLKMLAPIVGGSE